MIVEPAALPSDLGTLVPLNNAAVPAVNALSEDGFAEIAAMGTLLVARDGDQVVGTLLLLPPDTAYDSLNYAWFRARYDTFLYVDRIVVDPSAKGLGVGRALYETGFKLAVEEGYPRICAEVNVKPPNPASHAFHKRLGFTILEERHNPQTDKVVSMMVRPL